jgi:poly(A) polymerase
MVEPRVIPRAEHTVSRRDIDPDALKVLYRLRQSDHVAYLVGGSVRDLLLGRRPKDFDIGTSAHPYQIKKLFRNCWIIGRRFRLAHVKFGQKVIEVATFRRQVLPGEEVVEDGVPAHVPAGHEAPPVDVLAQTVNEPSVQRPPTQRETTFGRDNTFGTSEEDAFRRDFTINALFYDIATFSLIDYTGGMKDLQAGIVRSIGDPGVRFVEDPVRMMRAVALASRLGFTIDLPIAQAIGTYRHEIARSAPARLLEEYYKILRAGAAEKTFRGLASARLLEPVSPELQRAATDPLWRSLAAVDAYRARFESIPQSLTNAVLLGSLLVPLGLEPQPARWPRTDPEGGEVTDRRPVGPQLGSLPLARRDVEQLRHVLSFQRRLRDLGASSRAQRALIQRGVFRDSLTWIDIHGGAPDIVAHWTALANEEPSPEQSADAADHPPTRRKRRRRRRRPSRQASN